MTNREVTSGQWLGLLLALLLLMALMFCAGCSTTKACTTLFPKTCLQTVPEVVYVTDYEKPTKLPQAERPAKALPEAEPTDWRAVLTAMGGDLLACYEWGEQLYHTIGAYNTAVDAMPETPPE